ncbi:MAG TPA: CAP domain-containing protein [Acidimicrobiales bacterium]|nr:CAP domain-containing protein [Acidimicrobiales bacterium]
MLTAVAFAATVFAPSLLAASPASAAAPGVSPTIAMEFEWAIEVVRTQRGLPPLAIDPSVANGAQEWSGGMALFDTLVHDLKFSSELATIDPGWQAEGENVGVGGTPQSIEAAFVASPPHLANMLGNFTHMGVGVFVDGAGRIWVTERFYR